jgi:hypothetical protein
MTTDEPTIYEAMRHDLVDATRMSNTQVGERKRDNISAAALIDIAESLRFLAEATDYANAMRNLEDDDEREQDDSPDDAPLEPGDTVALAQLVDDGVALDPADLYVVVAVGITEGAQWITLTEDPANGVESGRAWASQYRRVPADAGSEHEAAAEVEPDAAAETLKAFDADLDALDDDFVPVATDAFEALKSKSKGGKR